ncbi:MAG TPA: tRNA preQ1(34) S-adenosylmethionine ribosyltransferase-isomerase QueA [Rectinema sp.]|jgi:S-adenosylmethionine:tRNA ribosyltransferase-isomerase|nr:tRNA preQ1(34) S-adenosylmethionine ribosyltransferase-isomerase QueA [Spirochaetota bacterium]OQC75149.1 MAG: S-adenosylmethionine:tRNA ribosyltransferase-isomerase [Spirochaetes bacterium ADurb.Bin001]HNP92361.1 tRNA preQ1(34) S-adenosylmethionine ribosyltransferase-isomerase QueA [Rectinema sp.]HNT58501.1 tRNA preQ1(34) S-adenosylmethionine ribosyltransferase-isomerase QueA [Rectinema sp.]HNV35503.1 tRNA preQ1(34) S-adenosylmethionine ribosyltransferase-isomerase QueA [Rectinema sp.]
MKTDSFDFDLPEHLIAQYPTEQRGRSRLLVLDRKTGNTIDSMVEDIVSFIEPGTLMVFNDSKVRKARLYGTCEQTGTIVEFVFLSPWKQDDPTSLGDSSSDHESQGDLVKACKPISTVSRLWRAICNKSKQQKIGRSYMFPGQLRGSIIEDRGHEKTIEFSFIVGDEYFDLYGHVPLPPYIKREDTSDDELRYQTVYAKHTGSAASPTAGLHFTPQLLDELSRKGIEIEYLTLHIGLGTFQPVRADNVEDHQMHEEWFDISLEAADKINLALSEGRKVLAVGTTSMRALESAWYGGKVKHGNFSTRIFIYPGYEFHVVDSLFTNFHTPKSTLLMLVSAFAGREKILECYRLAIEKNYRFFSYGDAMLIL